MTHILQDADQTTQMIQDLKGSHQTNMISSLQFTISSTYLPFLCCAQQQNKHVVDEF